MTTTATAVFKPKLSAFDFISNPGARLYQKGIHMNAEKQKFIAIQRKQLAEQELESHCTFHPKLVTKDYYLMDTE